MVTIIQMRRGSYTNFDPSKMKPGELAVVQSNDPIGDGTALYFCVSAGNVKRLTSYEDILNEIYNATEEIAQQIETEVADDVARAEAAAQSVEASVAQIATNTADIAVLKDDLTLLEDEIPDTVQTYTFSSGAVSQVTHSRNNTAIRTDAFTYGTNTITEVRTLNTGASLTIVTNLTTLETTVTYAAA